MVFIDEILWDFITQKIAELQANPQQVYRIFEGRSTARIEMIKQWIQTTKMRVVMHHPRDASELPCYAIVLQGANETPQTIGSSGDQYDEVVISNMGDGWVGSDSDILRAVPVGTPTIAQFYSRLQVKDGQQSCHISGQAGTCVGKGVWINFENTVVEKPDISSMDQISFWIKSNRVGTFLEFGFGTNAHREHVYNFAVTAVGVWEKITINIKAVPKNQRRAINYMSFKVLSDSVFTDVYIANLKGELALGEILDEAFFDNTYRVECWSNNANMTMDMYYILLWNFLKYRGYLETTWGQLEVKYEGGDLMPQPEWYPEFVYIRALVFHSKTIETAPREEDLESLEDVDVGKIDYGVGGGSITDP